MRKVIELDRQEPTDPSGDDRRNFILLPEDEDWWATFSLLFDDRNTSYQFSVVIEDDQGRQIMPDDDSQFITELSAGALDADNGSFRGQDMDLESAPVRLRAGQRYFFHLRRDGAFVGPQPVRFVALINVDVLDPNDRREA